MAYTLLSDAHIAHLDAIAGTPSLLNAHIDQIVGYRGSSAGGRGGPRGALLFSPEQRWRAALTSHDVGALLLVLEDGDVMHRAVACLRLLTVPRRLAGNFDFDSVLCRAQHTLSAILVDHPVLMHNRVFVASTPFEDSEKAPLPMVLAHAPRAELPRACHGVALEKLRAFAKHPCVVAGLTQRAPMADLLAANPRSFQGLSTLESLVKVGSLVNRARWLTSVLELDQHRAAAGRALGRRPASFLAQKAEPAKGNMEVLIANSFLAEARVSYRGGEVAYQDDDFLRALASSGIAAEPWFSARVEGRLARWATVPAQEREPALERLGDCLLALGVGGAKTQRELARWLIPAFLDLSWDRRIAHGDASKGLPAVDVAGAQTFWSYIDSLDPEGAASGELDALALQALGNDESQHYQSWRAALRERAMHRVIDRARAGAEAAGAVRRATRVL